MLIPFGVFSAAGAGGGASAGSFELISTTFGTGSSPTITFDVTGLGSTYKHLQFRSALRSDSGTYPHAFMRFNSDSGSNYARHYIFGDGSSVTSGGTTSTTGSYAMEVVGSSIGANQYGVSVVDVLDAFSSSKNKTVRSLTGWSGAGIFLESGVWLNTAAVTSVTLSLNTGNFTTASRISIYGIKA